MNTPDIIAFLRVKNEKMWIKSCLDSLSPICRGIVVLDDGSTDNTFEICENHPKVLEVEKQSGLPFDELRDANKAFKMARKHDPEFILRMDGDEILQPNAKEILFEELTVLYPNADVYELQFLTMWDDMNKYRYDGVYSTTWYKTLLRMENQHEKDLIWHGSSITNVPHHGRIPPDCHGYNDSIRSKVKVLHYGYLKKQTREKNRNFYISNDTNQEYWDNYKHTVSGEGRFSGIDGIKLKTLLDSFIPEIVKK